MDEIETDVDARPSGRRQCASGTAQFTLRFPAHMIPALAVAYDDDDQAAFEAGRRIGAGSRGRKDLMAIFEWKTRGRGRSRLAGNTDDEIADALNLTIVAQTDRAAMAVLIGLTGVDIPVASAIATIIDPQRFTIIDFRTIWSLGVERVAYYSVGFYLDYLASCRRIAADVGTNLRTLDRALWQIFKRKSATGRPIRVPSG